MEAAGVQRRRRRAIITSALPYSNGEIHLGHVASTYLPADVTCRYLRLAGVEAYYICASDDFGTPILIQSEREGVTPQEYVEGWNRRDREDFEAFGIRFDHFSQTSSSRNVEFVQDVFAKLYDSGHIFEREVVQFYCEADAKFLPDRYVKGACPYCGAADQYSDLCEACGRVPEEILHPKCAICGAAPTKRSSTHAFFRLSSFADALSEWLDGNRNLQRDVKRYVQNWIESGLADWDITRDIPWGVPLPQRLDGGWQKRQWQRQEEDGKNAGSSKDGRGGADPESRTRVFYGWFDNHLAYISSAVEFLESRGEDGRGFWNSSDIYHFIGKDIVYHHYLFLPAIRLGIGSEFKLPDYIPTRGHLTLQSRKISKSRNWYIGLREFLRYYPADYLRFYLISSSPYSQDDLNFDWDDFATRINSELIGNLGNLVNRALGFVARKFGGTVPGPGAYGAEDEGAASQIAALASDVGALMDQNHLDRALKRVMAFSAHFNQYFQHSEPWKGVSPRAENCIYLSVNAVRSLAVASYPFLPESAGRMWGQLGLEEEEGGRGPAGVAWGEMSRVMIKPGHRLGTVAPLFERVSPDGIARHKERFTAAPAPDAGGGVSGREPSLSKAAGATATRDDRTAGGA